MVHCLACIEVNTLLAWLSSRFTVHVHQEEEDKEPKPKKRRVRAQGQSFEKQMPTIVLTSVHSRLVKIVWCLFHLQGDRTRG